MNRQNWVVAVLDLDGFKKINDQFGHDAGDEILKSIVARLQKKVGKKGFVGRLGGDEFAIAMKVYPGDDAKALVEHIRSNVVDDPVAHDLTRHQVGMTAGIATSINRFESAIALLEQADRALIAGKSIRKNTTYSGATALVQSLPSPQIQSVELRPEVSSTDRVNRNL
jgi:diguanylate cyclase (GGDEF)-like protein